MTGTKSTPKYSSLEMHFISPGFDWPGPFSYSKVPTLWEKRISSEPLLSCPACLPPPPHKLCICVVDFSLGKKYIRVLAFLYSDQFILPLSLACY